MKARIEKWGSSLAVRIPKSFAAKAGLRVNATVELSLVSGSLILEPMSPQPVTLDELLRGVTDDNLPRDWEPGQVEGKEVW